MILVKGLASAILVNGILGNTPSANPISVTCNQDNTIDVSIDYDQKAEVLEFKYGSCSKDNVGRTNLTQQANFGWDFTLDVDACGMNDKLRNLIYNQTITMRIGRNSNGQELTLANFAVESYCTYTSAYKVKFDYGQLKAETAVYASDAGLVNLTFALKSYNANFSVEETNSKQAGDMINLGLTIDNANFDHADDIATSKTGKTFAPKKCEVSDENSQTYTLFDHEANDCKNDDVNFSISFSQEKKMWQFSHILFLIGNYETSKLSLSCDVIVCDKQNSGDCDAVMKNCVKPVDAVLTWGEYGNCSKTCGGGEKKRNATCVGPKFFGKACGSLEETAVCNNQTCAVDGVIAWSSWGACDNPASQWCKYDSKATKTRNGTCTPPIAGGKPCGNLTETVACSETPCGLGNCPTDTLSVAENKGYMEPMEPIEICSTWLKNINQRFLGRFSYKNAGEVCSMNFKDIASDVLGNGYSMDLTIDGVKKGLWSFSNDKLELMYVKNLCPSTCSLYGVNADGVGCQYDLLSR